VQPFPGAKPTSESFEEKKCLVNDIVFIGMSLVVEDSQTVKKRLELIGLKMKI